MILEDNDDDNQLYSDLLVYGFIREIEIFSILCIPICIKLICLSYFGDKSLINSIILKWREQMEFHDLFYHQLIKDNKVLNKSLYKKCRVKLLYTLNVEPCDNNYDIQQLAQMYDKNNTFILIKTQYNHIFGIFKSNEKNQYILAFLLRSQFINNTNRYKSLYVGSTPSFIKHEYMLKEHWIRPKLIDRVTYNGLYDDRLTVAGFRFIRDKQTKRIYGKALSNRQLIMNGNEIFGGICFLRDGDGSIFADHTKFDIECIEIFQLINIDKK